jgi:8-oxo-dGDP phosphatase
MSDWKTLSSEEIYKTAWIRVRRDEVLNQNGKPLTYSVVELVHPSVLIVAANADGQICMFQNYRYTLDKTMWEIPAGLSDGQDALTAAKRELMEETGLQSDDWTELGVLYQATGMGKMPFTAFLARNVQPAEGERDKDEPITNQRFFSLGEIEKMAQNGELAESAPLAALYLAKLHGL